MLRMETVISAIVPQYATLMGGAKGIKRMITNIHNIENKEIAAYIRDNELIFITGVALGEGETLADLIDEVLRKQVAGIIINTGFYIKEIPSSIVTRCNELHIPLISLPWKYVLSDLQKIIFKELVTSQYKEDYQTYLLEQLLHRTRRPHTDYAGIFQFAPSDMYCIAIIKMASDFNDPASLKQVLKACFTSDYVMDEENIHQTTLLFHRRSIQDLHQYSDQLEQCLKPLAQPYQIGLSQACSRWEDLPSAYEEAQLALSMATEIGYEMPFTALFQDMTLLKIIKSIPDPKLLSDFVQETLGKIIEYDANNHTDSLHFLQVWIKHNGNPSKIAAELYIHRNTVAYRINKIKSILGCTELTGPITSQLFFALLIRKTLQL